MKNNKIKAVRLIIEFKYCPTHTLRNIAQIRENSAFRHLQCGSLSNFRDTAKNAGNSTNNYFIRNNTRILFRNTLYY